jgi:Tfp pilus assembly protein PilN
MAKKCIGIDIGQRHLRAVQIARTPDGFLVEKTFGMQTRRSTDSPVEILRSLVGEQGFDRHADVATSLPHHTVFFTETQTDDAGLHALRAGNVSFLKDDFPLPGGETIVQVCSARKLPEGSYSALVAATSYELLEEHLGLFDEARMLPGAVDAPITALRTAVLLNYPEMGKGTALILYVDESALNLMVVQDGGILMVRNIPLFMRLDSDADSLTEQIATAVESEVEITWRKLFGSDPDADLRVYFATTRGAAEELAAAIQEKVEGRVITVDPFAVVRRSKDARADGPVLVAEGLALRMLSADQTDRVDFLAAYRQRTRPRWNARRQLTVCAALLAATALVWFTGLLIQLSVLETEYGRLKHEIESVFREALPEEKNIVNPLVQLQQKLETYQEDQELFSSFRPGRLSALETLDVLSTYTPAEGNLRLNDVLIAADSVRVTGACDSFATVSQWQNLLVQKQAFEAVEIQSQKKDAQTGKVHFTLSLSSAQTEP